MRDNEQNNEDYLEDKWHKQSLIVSVKGKPNDPTQRNQTHEQGNREKPQRLTAYNA